MGPRESFLVSIAAAAVWQCVWFGLRTLTAALLPRLLFLLGSLLLIVGEWLRKKGGLDVKSVLINALVSCGAYAV
jgi:hypothetical protein